MEDKIGVAKTCPFCLEPHVVYVYPEDVKRWQTGVHAQNAFSYLTADEREILISGTCGTCWNKQFAEV